MGAVTALLFEPLGVEWLLGFVFVFYLKRKELGAFNTLLPLPGNTVKPKHVFQLVASTRK